MDNIADVPPRTQYILDQLKVWCDAKYGRRTEVADELGLPPQAITDWLKGRRQPTAEQVLHLQDFLSRKT